MTQKPRVPQAQNAVKGEDGREEEDVLEQQMRRFTQAKPTSTITSGYEPTEQQPPLPLGISENCKFTQFY